MQEARRPPTPPDFNHAAQAARKEIRDIVKANRRPREKQFADVWSKFKDKLAEAQHGRCGYCDRHVLGGDDGTVDHYRPKTEVEALFDDPSTWGNQRAHSASVEGRKTHPVSDLGYHWLAYAWRNYIFACSCCNEKWKRAIFPVAAHPRCRPPRARGREDPLLLSCYTGQRPSEHFQFNQDGSVEPANGSRHGYETIRTVGLDRDPLRLERCHPALDTHEALRQLADGEEVEAVRSLRRLGDDKRPFAGVVRAIVEQRLELRWGDFLTTFVST
jgi:hypothetical protein